MTADNPLDPEYIRRLLMGEQARYLEAATLAVDSMLPVTNLEKAAVIVRAIADIRAVQVELKAAFKGDELDGGWRAALTHPLYLDAEAAIADLREQLKVLI